MQCTSLPILEGHSPTGSCINWNRCRLSCGRQERICCVQNHQLHVSLSRNGGLPTESKLLHAAIMLLSVFDGHEEAGVQEAALAQEWELRKARKQVKTDAKGQVADAESRSLYINWRRVLKPLRADEEATAAVRKRRDKSLLLALENYRLCVPTSELAERSSQPGNLQPERNNHAMLIFV